ncbi:MAG TPA: GAF and ANTAR domain-containing protein [Actinophytocola sp.]
MPAEDALSGQLEDIACTLDGLLTILDTDEGLDAVLGRLAQTALLALDGADAVTVTMLDGPTPRTATATSSAILLVGQAQYAEGEGPDLESARTRSPVRVSVEEVADRWPAFAEAARALGIHSYLAAPLVFPAAHEREDELVGSLNIYGCTPDVFDPVDTAVVCLLNTAAATAIGNARRYLHTRELVDQLRAALVSRGPIDQAKGALMALYGVDAERAFAQLVHRSQHRNLKVAEVARQVLAAIGQPREP